MRQVFYRCAKTGYMGTVYTLALITLMSLHTGILFSWH
jgi:hypothetical protein